VAPSQLAMGLRSDRDSPGSAIGRDPSALTTGFRTAFRSAYWETGGGAPVLGGEVRSESCVKLDTPLRSSDHGSMDRARRSGSVQGRGSRPASSAFVPLASRILTIGARQDRCNDLRRSAGRAVLATCLSEQSLRCSEQHIPAMLEDEATASGRSPGNGSIRREKTLSA